MELNKYNQFQCSNSTFIPEEAHEMGKNFFESPDT